MTLTELRCPRCDAPLDASSSAVTKCRYCGASLVRSALEPTASVPSSEDAKNPGFLDVCLDDFGPNKIAVIHTVRDHLRLGLKDSLDLVDKTPCTLAQAMEGGAAKSFLAALANAGAKAHGE